MSRRAIALRIGLLAVSDVPLSQSANTVTTIAVVAHVLAENLAAHLMDGPGSGNTQIRKRAT